MAYNDRERGKRHKECSFLRSRSYDIFLEQNRLKLTVTLPVSCHRADTV